MGYRKIDDYFGRCWRLLWRFCEKAAAVTLGGTASTLGANLIVDRFGRSYGPHENLVLVAVLAILILALIIPAYFKIREDSRVWQWDTLKEHLLRRASPDCGDYYAPQIEFQIRRRDSAFKKQFTNLPAERREVILLLKQVASNKRRDSGYELSSLQSQIEIAVQQIDDKNKKFGGTQTKLRWVCFVTKYGKFVAFEDFNVFRVRVCQHHAQEYVNILNTPDTGRFVELIKWHADIYVFQRTEGIDPVNTAHTKLSFEQVIPDLLLGAITEGKSRAQVLQEMCELESDHAMLVTRRDHKPVGVISVLGLAEQLLPEKTLQEECFIEEAPDEDDESKDVSSSDEGETSGSKKDRQAEEVNVPYAADDEEDAAVNQLPNDTVTPADPAAPGAVTASLEKSAQAA